MRIALDVSSAARPQATGVAMYIRRLVAGLARQGSGHQFSLAVRGSRLKNIFYQPELPAPNFSRKLIFAGCHPFFARRTQVYHDLDARVPGEWMKAPKVVTIHDVFSVLQSGQFATAEFRAMKRARYQDIVRRAARIVCVSQAVKRAVLETLDADERKLRVVYEAAGPEFFPRGGGEVQAVRAKHGLGLPYFFFAGSINKRKNVPALIAAFAQARKRTGSSAVLALAGRMGFGGEEIRAAQQQSELGGALRFLGYVPDADIPALYSGAQALLFATLYEGFGIPAVEAFSCGCPVIGATTGSLPEIIGGAGLLADPASEGSIAAQIERLMTDEPLRQACIGKGLARAKDFSWDKAARECLDIYRELI